ncbi:RNA polymerase sigma-70 factor (ECF subfamily) [Methylopila capsulata]|uniref:DNA-directed RNA polymerase sigma-70 factor n=1 Tax=Methylopila capsulata TaxID=61654 RepID=A0A9W6MTL3_9HYPH|nr:sigma-70 family RNA polymerase sigma factor [Methylopila capsulata]MBM7853415.1 RNA polymerase sigma-70 factor (ECF subfamily) [Methylopila capsulata]GLK57372.1 DNA-directed RNA polymerase sigma-70 factor [Methylopila capsulata]
MPAQIVEPRAPGLLEALLAERTLLVGMAQKILKCRLKAEDVVQDVAVKLCQDPPKRAIQRPGSYLRRMVRNHAIDSLRRSVGESAQMAATADMDALASPCACPQDRIATCQELCLVARALQALPSRTRQAFVAHRLGGEPQNAIAARLQVSPTLVNFMMRDATASCRKALEPDESRSAA